MGSIFKNSTHLTTSTTFRLKVNVCNFIYICIFNNMYIANNRRLALDSDCLDAERKLVY